jgi:hypothetical protein
MLNLILFVSVIGGSATLGGEWAECIILAFAAITISVKSRAGGLWVVFGVLGFVLLPFICGAIEQVVVYVVNFINEPTRFLRAVRPMHLVAAVCGIGIIIVRLKLTGNEGGPVEANAEED